jgi:small subunit ribosomal protein S4
MGRNIKPKNKVARRFGVNLGLKTNAASVARRLTQGPGIQGANRRRKTTSSYGKQLEEKQKAKEMYGMRERQFRNLVKEAGRLSGNTATNIQMLLERRLDNVVYRLGFASTRAQARQFVGHNLFMVNGKKMNIPSYCVKEGDVITVKPSKAKKGPFTDAKDRIAGHELPSWLKVDAAALTGTVLHMPAESDFDKVFDVTLIIEFYSTR